ncbi:MAG: N-acetyl-gamma-glutamyl-phosphate reductase [Kiritimatiellae bacterium]|nr:N-acetyl-gamma-glutamyl-phosphate reductase [Kiritimatiellia bacterium]
MGRKKIFIDGSAGTTGLRIRERLSSRDDLEVIALPEHLRKDLSARRDALNSCDVAMLCLPDAAAIEAAAMVVNPDVVVIDTSTAHRTNGSWEYGFPELAGRRERIASSKRIANPGCHASGFVALVEPLVRAGVISRDALLHSFSLTGYSGGGKKMIADYEGNAPQEEATERDLLKGGRQYALGQTHKHLKEMVAICALDHAPCFSPIVVPDYSGMEVTVQLHSIDIAAVAEVYRSTYGIGGGEGMVRFVEDASEGGMLSSSSFSQYDDMELSVHGNAERAILVARFDNLGKGASGAAIQNMNIVLGVEEDKGLCRRLG